jgi:hypothetical protein
MRAYGRHESSTSGSWESSLGPHVMQFTPQRTVKSVRQVGLRFSEPMVPLAAPHNFSDPFEVDGYGGAARRHWPASDHWRGP